MLNRPLLLLFLFVSPAFSQPVVLESDLRHLRNVGPREWDEFPQVPHGTRLEVQFASTANRAEQTIRLRQQDVKQRWHVRLNDQDLGQLRIDENDMVIYLAVPAGTLRTGKNQLRIEPASERQPQPDDVRVGQIVLDPRPRQQVLGEANIQVTVVDADTGQPVPSRITILDQDGALQETGAESNDELAVRPGTIFTRAGQARFGVPAGRYTIFAGRGPEYSLASETVSLVPGAVEKTTLSIRREVPTEGYVACDPHIHTLTDSGHGDATVQERMITIAAEGIELAVATDHNVHVNHAPLARQMEVHRYFTSVIGNEVTTPVGHFNIFPVPPAVDVPDHRLTDWPAIFAEIQRATAAPVVILNHARDLHSKVRPFGPERHNTLIGAQRNGWPIGFNGMEVINSGATQSDILQLFGDWMALLNGGHAVTPVGSSDSHDVARHFVGQGRTYIRCEDHAPGQIDVVQAVESFLAGRVIVSYGLLAQLKVAGHSSGDLLAPDGSSVDVEVQVLGPHWINADHVALYVNGVKIREASISPDDAADLPRGIKWQARWTVPCPKHDAHLVAIAQGPGVAKPYWTTAKPYQPTSPQWTPRVLGCSGALWLDVDRDGRQTSAREYAERIWQEAERNLERALARLADYDRSVAVHVAHLAHTAGQSLTSPAVRKLLLTAAPHVQAAFATYRKHELKD